MVFVASTHVCPVVLAVVFHIRVISKFSFYTAVISYVCTYVKKGENEKIEMNMMLLLLRDYSLPFVEMVVCE